MCDDCLVEWDAQVVPVNLGTVTERTVVTAEADDGDGRSNGDDLHDQSIPNVLSWHF